MTLTVLMFAILTKPAQAQEYRYKAEGFKPSVLKSDAKVIVTQTTLAWHFKPWEKAKSASLVFCPGGLVDPTAYAPLARAISEHGYPVFVVKLGPQYESLDTQKLDGVNKISEILTANKGTRFVIGGHSLGGAISSLYAHEYPTRLQGLFLCGTTHPRDFDLSSLSVPVTKVLGTNDGIARQDQTDKHKGKLPKHTVWLAIEGGNHSQFGWYGIQPGDQLAKITREKQQEAVQKALLELLDLVAKMKS